MTWPSRLWVSAVEEIELRGPEKDLRTLTFAEFGRCGAVSLAACFLTTAS